VEGLSIAGRIWMVVGIPGRRASQLDLIGEAEERRNSDKVKFTVFPGSVYLG